MGPVTVENELRSIPGQTIDELRGAAILRRLEALETKIDRLQADHDQARELVAGYAKKAKTIGSLLKRIL